MLPNDNIGLYYSMCYSEAHSGIEQAGLGLRKVNTCHRQLNLQVEFKHHNIISYHITFQHPASNAGLHSILYTCTHSPVHGGNWSSNGKVQKGSTLSRQPTGARKGGCVPYIPRLSYKIGVLFWTVEKYLWGSPLGSTALRPLWNRCLPFKMESEKWSGLSLGNWKRLFPPCTRLSRGNLVLGEYTLKIHSLNALSFVKMSQIMLMCINALLHCLITMVLMMPWKVSLFQLMRQGTHISESPLV